VKLEHENIPPSMSMKKKNIFLWLRALFRYDVEFASLSSDFSSIIRTEVFVILRFRKT